MYDGSRMIVAQLIVQVLQVLDYTPLVFVVSEAAGVDPAVVLLQRTYIIRRYWR